MLLPANGMRQSPQFATVFGHVSVSTLERPAQVVRSKGVRGQGGRAQQERSRPPSLPNPQEVVPRAPPLVTSQSWRSVEFACIEISAEVSGQGPSVAR